MTQDQINYLSNHDGNLNTKLNLSDYKVKVPNMIKKLFSCEKCLHGKDCEEHK